MLEWLIIGLLVGMTLGLTGSGGGLISIPLLIHLAQLELKVATIFSLFAVVCGAVVNWLPNRVRTEYVVSVCMILASFLTSFLVARIKNDIPNLYIQLSLVIICLLSLWSFWKGRKNQGESRKDVLKVLILKSVFGGLLLGCLTTFTGLGGGVLLMPILLGILRIEIKNALPTSLFVIALSSLGSIWFQKSMMIHHFNLMNIVLLLVGTIISVFLIRFFSQKMPNDIFLNVRKTVFTVVVIVAILGIF